MELIAKVSKGSVMDQIYLPKKRAGFPIGKHVLVSSLESKKTTEKPYFYHVKQLSPIKIRIIEEIFALIDSHVEKYDNIIITGSFLDQGFIFNDLDILLITEEKVSFLQKILEDTFRVKIQLLILDYKSLLVGLSTDPLYQSMLSQCVAKKRIIYKQKHTVIYQILDLHLLKSQTLPLNFDFLNGNEKYYLTRNMISILLFVQGKKITKERLNTAIKKIFHLKDIDVIKKNMLDKASFIKTYKHIYDQTFALIMSTIPHGTKQK
ncbi:hypothetical protein J4410_05310 [Candidatus Woesearchaeota archaeon]|nr:hypothetical protein [Candidatus Woesearchaeota archaeon]